MSRKTIEIETLRKNANTFLADSADEMVGERRGIALLLERALFETMNYKGFVYLSSEWDDATDSLRDGFDDTRRSYR